MPNNKEKIKNVIDLLKKEAEANESSTAKKITAEDTFNSELLKSASKEGEPKVEATDIAKAIISELEKQANEENEVKKDNEKTAGVSALGAVVSAPGVDAPDAGDPSLGKTQTTTNEIEKGLVAKAVTDKVNAIINQLTAQRGVGPSVIVDEQTNAVMPALGKQSELEKEAAEKRAAAGKVLQNLFEKFATVEKEEEKTEAMGMLEKFASLAEDMILDSGVKEGEYDETHIQKVAEALITNQLIAEAEAEQVKQAAYEFGSDVADAFYARLNQYGQAELQKQAAVEQAVATAKSLLEKKANNYTEEDVQKVVEFLLAQQEAKAPADAVIDELKVQ